MRESLVFVEDMQVVLLIKQTEFWPSPHCGPSSEQNYPGPCFQNAYSRIVAYGYMHETDILGWSEIGAQRVSVPLDPRPGSQVLVKGFGLESPSLLQCPEPVCLAKFLLWKPSKPLNCPFNKSPDGTMSSQGSVLHIGEGSGQFVLQGSATSLQIGPWMPQAGDIGAERGSDFPKIIQAVHGRGEHTSHSMLGPLTGSME